MWKDPEYLKEWEEIKNLRQKAGYPIDFNDLWLNNDYRNTKNKEFMIECRITEKFDYMGMFINPQKSFDEMITGNNNVKLSLRAYLIGVFHSRAVNINPSDASYDPNGLIIKIEYGKINHVTNTINLISDEITIRYQLYLNENKKESLNKTDFDKIYQVGVLKEANYSDRKIAKELYPGEPVDSAKDKVKQHHARYIELINGGWRKIKFP